MSRTDLAGGQPTQVVPELMNQELVASEQLLRYWCAAAHAEGRTVLDAGCGLGHGAAALAAGGAKRVDGVDRSADVTESASDQMPPNVSLTTADIQDLPFDDGSFELITCFDVIEQSADPDAVLDELSRVASEDALVFVSFSERPLETLSRRFANVELLTQQNATVSLLLPDDQLDVTGQAALRVGELGKTFGVARDGARGAVAVASNGPLPPLSVSGCVSDPVDVRRWAELYAEQQETLRQQAEALSELDALRGQVTELTSKLEESEMAAAEVPSLRSLKEDAEYHAHYSQHVASEIEAKLNALENRRSRSWRATRPVRLLKRLAGR